MSGYVPPWLQVGKEVFYNGKKRKVLRYFFTQAPGEYADELNVVLSGVKQALDPLDLIPIPCDDDLDSKPADALKAELVKYRDAIRVLRDAKRKREQLQVQIIIGKIKFIHATDVNKYVDEIAPEPKWETVIRLLPEYCSS